MRVTPEIELLYICARGQLTSEQSERIGELATQPAFDWPYLLKIAHQHNLTPLVYRHLKTVGANVVPPTISQELQTFWNELTRHNLVLTSELIRVIKFLQAQQLSVLVFKGPILSQQAYGNVTMRQYADLDILVPRADIDRARQLLQDLGYEAGFKLTAAQLKAFPKTHSEEPFWYKDTAKNPVMIDLHWELLLPYYSFAPDETLAWTDTTHVTIGNAKIPTLSDENLLLFLCVHAAKHNWQQLGQVADIAQLIRNKPAIDWQSLIAHQYQLGNRRMLLLGLYLAHQLLDCPLPAHILRQFETALYLPKLLKQVQANMFEDNKAVLAAHVLKDNSGLKTRLIFDYGHRLYTWLNKDAIFLSSTESLKDKGQYWFNRFLRPETVDWEMLPLPNQLSFLYYPFRPLRLLFSYLFRRNTTRLQSKLVATAKK